MLVENTQHKERKGGKWEDRYKGPYTIHESLGKGVYTLKSMSGNVLKNKHNIVISRYAINYTLFIIT